MNSTYNLIQLIEDLTEAKGPKLKANIRKQVNKELTKLTTKTYFDKIPLSAISEILSKYGIILIQEDNKAWSGMVLGDDANDTFSLAPIESKDDRKMYAPYTNVMMWMSWHKMTSGRYEIVVYLT